MAIQIIQDGRRPPSWIMEESVFGPFSTFWDPIICVHTKFGEDILIDGEDILPNKIRKNAPWRRISTSGSNFDAISPAATFVCVIVQNFSLRVGITKLMVISIIDIGKRCSVTLDKEHDHCKNTDDCHNGHCFELLSHGQ